jgi:hypothetical protein
MSVDAEARRFVESELERLDWQLHREILRLRARYQLSTDEFRGLYISDRQVDALIKRTAILDPAVPEAADLTARARAAAERNARHRPRQWRHVQTIFGLDAFECDVLLLALALEVDLKYETLYGYLNNDVTRKFPTVDLALRVCGERGVQLQQASLLASGRLLEFGLLDFHEGNAGSRSSLSQGFTINASLATYLLGLPVKERSLDELVTFRQRAGRVDPLPADPARVEHLLTRYRAQQGPQVAVLEGRRGSGRAQLAMMLCQGQGLRLFCVDAALLARRSDELRRVLDELCLNACLCRAGIYLDLQECNVPDEGQRRALQHALSRMFRLPVPVFAGVLPDAAWQQLLTGFSVYALSLSDPGSLQRRELWQRELQEQSLVAAEGAVEALADRFTLNRGQIAEAVRRLGAESDGGTLDAEQCLAAARTQSEGAIGTLAQKARLKYGWDDLVLPETTVARVRDVVAAIRHRARVYRDWGMAGRVNNPDGLTVLFSGASGTGKTMTAGVIARDLGLNLYRIDLAGVVSKYIGETEKNLDRIFDAAKRANGILFLDEADALLGKRSEVKDAHDRYANIEVAYLLQKMEEHEGVVILATNLYKNIDQAFARRIQYIVEFPKPDAVLRERLWREMFSERVPLSKDVDFRFLARQFNSTGGDIKNVALDAAFLAAQNGQLVTMQELVRAMARHVIKQGGAPSAADFKQYHRLIN